MSKRSADGSRGAEELLRRLPAVERVLSSPAAAASIEAFGRESFKGAVVASLDEVRMSGKHGGVSVEEICSQAERTLKQQFSSSLRRVINATGVIIHTNLGRSPLAEEIWQRAGELVCNYSNLEFDLEDGGRGTRDVHLESVATGLFGCEAAILTNNNAGATLLLLAAVAGGREVIVSRGELVEIGGSFRVPEVIQQGGARLREVGTTNRTRAADYRSAMGSETAALLKVHRSNFEITGFTEAPTIPELVEVAGESVPLLYDEGSGRVVDLAKYGFSEEPLVRDVLSWGVDAVTCSTDKLIGSAQGGLILGKKEIIARCRAHPLMRALRAGKESYAVITETLRMFLAGRHDRVIPIYRMLATSTESLLARAQAVIAGTEGRVTETRSVLGGGTTPSQSIPSVGILVPGNAQEVASRFLRLEVPIVGRIQDDTFTLDLRTVLEEEDDFVKRALQTREA